MSAANVVDMETNAFAVFWAKGYRNLIPIIPPGAPISASSSIAKRLAAGKDDRGKTPGIRNPDDTWRGLDWIPVQADEEYLTIWHGMGAGVGIKTGMLDDGTSLVMIDADTLNPERAEIILKVVEAAFGKLAIRVGNYPKAGYIVRVDGPFQYARIEFGDRTPRGDLSDRVEILSDGRQFVAHGIHPATLKPYRWPRGIPELSKIPVVKPQDLHDLLADLRPFLPSASEIRTEGAAAPTDQARLKGDPELVRRAVLSTPNTTEHFPTRESWRDYGYAIKGALPDDEPAALELFHAWSEGWVGEDGSVNGADYVDAEWSRFKPPFKVGASMLYEIAEKTSGGKFTRAEIWFDPAAAEKATSLSRNAEPYENSKPTKVLAFTGFDAAVASALSDATRPLIKGFLDCGAMSVLYGESNSGKTFVAMDIAAHVAAGVSWGGMRTTRAPVVYVAAEGGAGARKRAAALRARFPDADFSGFHFLLSPVNLLRADADLVPLIEAVRLASAAHGENVGLVVVDTLSRAMAGGDENASTDMGAMVRHLDAIRAATGAHLMTVHHSGKDRAKGARGHSLLRAATDTEIEIADRALTVTKQRDLDGEFSSAFDLAVVTLGVDADGDPITSCTVRLAAGRKAAGGSVGAGVSEVGEVRRVELTETGKEIMTAVLALREAADVADGSEWAGANIAELLVCLFDRGRPTTKKNADFYLRKLVASGHLMRGLRGRFVPRGA